MTARLLGFLALVTQVIGRDVPSFRKDYTYVPEARAYFKEHLGGHTWLQAEKICRSEGAMLAAPTTQEEAEQTTSQMKNPEGHAWIGIQDRYSEGTFLTVDGKSEIFINWDWGEPNNVNSSENCVVITRSARYNDENCNTWYTNFICKKDISSIKSSKRIALSLFPNDDPFFRSDYTYVKEVRLHLKQHSLPATWVEAVKVCASEDASLATPAHQYEAKILTDFLRPSSSPIWVGIHSHFSPKNFLTLDVQPLSKVYSVWGPGEPNYLNDFDNCVEMNGNMKYNDADCSRRLNYVCQKGIKDVQSVDTECETHDTAYKYYEEIDRCYKLHKIFRNWHDAYKLCKAEGSYLAILNSPVEARTLVGEINKLTPQQLKGSFHREIIHLGFNELVVNGVWQTNDGKPLVESGYDYWGEGQPDSEHDNEHCGSMTRNGALNDINCEVKAMFFCERQLSNPLEAELE